MFGLAQSQKMDGKSFRRNFLDLVWFSAYVVRREVGVSLDIVLRQICFKDVLSGEKHYL